MRPDNLIWDANSQTNGSAAIGAEAKTAEAAPNWREAAMLAALQHFEEDERAAVLLAAIRQQSPGSDTMVVSFERERLEKFLQTHAESSHDLLAGRNWFARHGEEFKHWPYLAWRTVRWRGRELEIALVPSTHSFDESVLFCANNGDDSTLPEFARELLEWCERPSGRALRYSEGWDDAPDLEAEINKTSWDDIVLKPELLRSIRESVEGFFTGREAYHTLGFAWRRGVLLIGPPGTGKTMLCKAVARAAPELPFLYVRDLREYACQDAIRMIFQRARQLAPCVLAFEDVDGFVTEFNRTLFLNELDGFHSNDGLLVIASSNHPGQIDEALLKRPSRFDRVFHIGLPEEAERAEYARRLLSRSGLASHLVAGFDTEKLALEVAAKTDGFTPAYLKEAFTAAALARAQNGALALDDEFALGVLRQIGELKSHLKKMKNPDALAEIKSGADSIGLRKQD